MSAAAGLAGGLIGGFMFGPVGFMVGSMLGNLLSPVKQEGPRLSDLRLQGSEYGKMIPILFGTGRIAGQVVWQTDLTPHKHTSGGKGGPQVTTYTYTASFAVKICKSLGPNGGLIRIWSDGTLIYDTTGQTNVDNTKVPITFYKGLESANPDPTMEAVLGVGNVPAFRDDCAAVFTDYDVGDKGNRLPNLEFEVFTNGGPIPWRVSAFTPFNLGVKGPNTAMIESGQLIISRWTGTSVDMTFERNTYTMSGVLVNSDPPIIGPVMPTGDGGGTGMPVFYCQNNPDICFVRRNNDGFSQNAGWYYRGAISVSLMDYYDAAGDSQSSIFYSVENSSVYVIAGIAIGAPAVRRYAYTAGAGVVGPSPTAVYSLPNGTIDDWQVTVDENGHVWSARDLTGLLATDVSCVHLDADLNLVDAWTKAEVPNSTVAAAGFDNGHLNFTVYGGNVMYAGADTVVYEPTHASWINLGSIVSNPPCNCIALGNGLALDVDGVVSMNPQPGGAGLDAIVAALSGPTYAGLDPSEYDVTDLENVTVPGYVVTSRTDVRNDLAPLMHAYFFDAVESSGVMKFVRRGGAIAVSIPDDDLAAQAPGGQPPPLIEVTRAEDITLPSEVSVSYYNTGASFQSGTQRATRQTTVSQTVADMQLPICMTDSDATRIAQISISQAWMERNSLIIRVPRKYLYIEPTDVVQARGKVMRIFRKQDKLDGTIELEGFATLASMYATGAPGNPPSGQAPPVDGSSQGTQLMLLDIPLISDTDDSQGFYAGMAGAVDNTWRGGTLQKSADNGASYTEVASAATGDVLGTCSTALGNFSGGNTFDQSNRVTVVVGPGGGELSSVTMAAVLNGANYAVVGLEVIQFTTATLSAPSTYVISGLLRGRRGTEWAINSHVVGERFCLLPVTDVSAPFSELGQARLYKAVTFGQTLSSASSVPFTNQGQAIRPYAPVAVGGAPITPFDGTVQINWLRRTRIGGAWNDFVDVPLSEPAEKYVVQIWDATFSLVARIIETTSPTATYTAAQQVADFGATQQHIYASVGQVGAYKLGTQTAVIVPGLGASDTAPISPIPPYNSNPPPPTGGCTLPTTINNFVWATPVSQFNPGASPAGTWVLTFTTPVTPVPGACHIDAAEYAGPPVQRDAVLALSPCGSPLTPASHVIGNTVSVIFYLDAASNPYPTIYPTLSPNTTYYFSINSLAASGMICNLAHP